jgi:mono/diheme cytochrome c family protein
MKRGLKISIVGLFIILALLVGGISATIGWRPFIGPKARPLTARTFEATPVRLERGKYLVEAVTGCFFCHSERDWQAAGAPPIESKKGAGAIFHGGPGKLYAPNITPDPATGIGKWSDDAIARAVREGVNMHGDAIFPIMPFPNYAHLSDEDMASIVVYLKSIPSVNNSVPRSEIIFPVSMIMKTFPQPIETPVASPDLSIQVKRGEYLVRQGSCTDCHTPQERGTRLPGLAFAGGLTLEEQSGKTTSTNITPDATGIGGYDENTFVNVMRTGRVGGKTLNSIMPWALYGKMTDEDLKAVFAYMKTIPAVKHIIDNSVAPTACRLCKGRHGLGNQN